MRVVATAGHVDHGKSTLVLALTGTDPDRFAEEKERGLTIDLGFAATTLPSGSEVAFVDVPGHVRFIKNMLAGVGAVDACLFVVAATEGWKPQSEEHLRILELLGIGHGVVALTKVGLVDQDARELATMELAERLRGSFLESAKVVPVDAPCGEGTEELVVALDELVQSVPAARDLGRPRLWVDRVFAAKGSGTVVTGTLTGGALRVEDDLVLAPAGAPVRVRSLQTHQQARERVAPGHRVAVNLSGISHTAVQRGDALVAPGQWHSTRLVDGSLRVLASLDHEVSRRGAYQAYLGSDEVPVALRVLGHDALAPGTTGAVRLHLARPLPLVPGDRFVLRESGRGETVGGGEVLDVAPVLPAGRARPDRTVDRVVRERGWVTPDELERLTGERRVASLGEWVVDPAALEQAITSLRAAIHDAGPLGLDTARLDDRQRAVLASIEDVLVESGRARLRNSGRVATIEHPFVGELQRAPFAPPAPPPDLDRAVLRELVRSGAVLEIEGILFAPSAIDAAAVIVARLLRDAPDGVTVSAIREALGTTRKWVMPLVSHLDATGVTRRRGDVRIAGPRLPAV